MEEKALAGASTTRLMIRFLLRKESRFVSAVVLFFWALVTTVGLVLIWNGFSRTTAPAWSTAPGTVIDATCTVQQNGTRVDRRLELVYRYSVEGTRYTGKGLGRECRREELLAVLREIGSNVVVYYDPERPATSRLTEHKRFPRELLVTFVAGMFISLFSTSLALGEFRSWRETLALQR
jgi:hypothetical protein